MIRIKVYRAIPRTMLNYYSDKGETGTCSEERCR
jgi:hypothetical protein